ncbi:MAG TPA: hypothetical protein VJ505_00975 [Holophagaceae bacterium]|nr:hypothetical protein [Holophagaceae bacterium]
MLKNVRTSLMKSLLLVLAGSAALQAQWDSRLQLGKTDFLDLYQSSGNKKAKPEVVTLLDFSGSMEAVMFHASYPNGDTADNATGDGNMKFTRSGSSSTNWAVSASLTLTNTSAYKGSFANLTGGILLRPDGTAVTRANVNTTASSTSVLMNGATASSVTLAGQAAVDKASDVRNWIRACSHVRFNYLDGTTTRTLDIPVPWRTMNAASSGYPLSGQTQYDAETGLNIELDTSFAVSGAQNSIWSNSSSIASVLIPNYRTDYVRWLFTGKDGAGKYIIPDALNASLSLDGVARVTFANGIPARTRTQAVKEAAIRTWISYQKKVFWAFRFLNPGGENSVTTVNPSTTSPGITNAATFNTVTTTGNDRTWYLMNNTTLSPTNSRTGMQRISALFASGNTPLTFAVANTLAQFQDSASVFNSVETGDDIPQDCTKHFLIAFTDGQPTSDNSPTNTTVYIGDGISGSADAGNKAINTAGKASMNPSGTNWNIMNYAGAAAHAQDSDISVTNKIAIPTYPAGASSPQNFVPNWIKSRNGVTFSTPHPVQVMTVGVSLGGELTDPAGGKFRLFATAIVGDPRDHDWALNSDPAPHAFELTIPSDPTSSPTSGSVYFFDAASPDKLVAYLAAAFKAIDDISGQSITATPVVPFSGVALAKQVYLGRFDLPDPNAPSPYWNGDLLMFPTGTVNGQTQLLQNSGTPVSNLDSKTAQSLSQWSAKSILNQENYWATRTIYTRPSATVTAPNPALVNFTDQTGAGKLDDFQASMDSALTLAQKQDLVRWTRGADTSVSAPYPNRTNLMGDIINSAPAVQEYGISTSSTPGVSAGSLPGTLSSALATHSGAKFRVLFVGTNTGFLHAFGEVSWETPYTKSDGTASTMVKGVAAELWSFIPTDFLPYLGKLRDNTQLHRFMVDGSPVVYHQDRPQNSNLAGDDIVNYNEKAYVIFGLRKGGRSYYSLDVSDPLNPKMAWALNPEEAAKIPASRVLKGTLAAAQTLVGSMGFSTSQPGLGRVFYSDNGSLHIRRAVFLGGGLSVPELEVAVGPAPTGGFGKPLGRSVLALDAATGEILQTWDLTGLPGIASIPAGVLPFQYFTNSGMVQRAYFGDRNGNIWALGSGQKSTVSPFNGFRLDSSALDRWTTDGSIGGTPAVRAIYQAPAKEKQSTLPTAFNIATFPSIRTTDPKISPAAVGVGFVSGDRNNPLDLWYSSPTNPAPTGHRLNVVFDRQDSYLLGLDSVGVATGQMQDMSSQTSSSASVIDPSSTNYYLKSKYGYYINFPGPTLSGTQTFIPKGVNEPLVLSGVLFYSYFKPTKGDTCNPGSGLTRTWRVCDVMNPVISNSAADTSVKACTPGFVMEWAGVASNFAAKGTTAVNQAGGVLDVGGGGATGTGVGTGKVAIGTAAGSYAETFPKPRVWRSVHSDQN